MTLSDLPRVHAILRHEFESHPAPILDFMAAQERDPFKILVATILSARTKDETTTVVVRDQLFPKIRSFADLRAVPLEELERLVFPVGFFRQKAKHLKALPEAVDRLFGGRIPETVEELCELPGVGRKTANLVVALAFGKPALCVDVHVHRICNRFGLLRTDTPYDTEMELRRILPEPYWISWNGSLVSFGQRRCTPLRPKCADCPLRPWCSRVGLPAQVPSPGGRHAGRK